MIDIIQGYQQNIKNKLFIFYDMIKIAKTSNLYIKKILLILKYVIKQKKINIFHYSQNAVACFLREIWPAEHLGFKQ